MKAFPHSDKNQKIYFIAEIGSNHNQRFPRLAELINESKRAGFDAIKLQFYKADKLWYSGCKKEIEAARIGELSRDMLLEARHYCNMVNIAMGCSVFDLESIDFVAKHTDFLKIASYECLWSNLIKRCKRTGLPLFISTGMCNAMDIYSVVTSAWPTDKDCLFHCSSQYPSSPKNVRLDILNYIIKSCKKTVKTQLNHRYNHIGYSDHSVSPAVIYKALCTGADIFECHVDLDNMQGNESKHGHCWKFDDIKEVIKVCHEMADIKTNNCLINGFSDRKDRKNIAFRTDPATGYRMG